MTGAGAIVALLRSSALASVVLAAHPSLAQTAEEDYAAAVGERGEGQIESAIAHLESALEKNPEHVAARTLLAVTEAAIGDWASAEKHIEIAVSLAPGDPDILLAQARISSWQGAYAEADSLVDQVLDDYPDYLDAWILKGRIAYYLDELSDADAALQRARRLEPDNLEVLIAIGDIQAAQGRIDEAQATYRTAYRLYPDSEEAAERAERVFEKPASWRSGASLSHSSIERIPLEDWWSLSAFVSKDLNDSNSLAVNLEYAHRYSLYDVQLAAVLNHRFSPKSFGYLSIGGTPKDDFLPAISRSAGGNIRWRDGGRRIGPSILEFDINYREYLFNSVSGLNLSLRQLFFDERLQLTYRSINSRASDSSTDKGWLARVDITASDRYRLYLAYADAPESERGIVTSTVSSFAGLIVHFTEALDFRVDYARHDRTNSYLRKDLAAGFSVRF